jgi:spore cortex formation protein SpoVR/YcgB (stage V sporulation)
MIAAAASGFEEWQHEVLEFVRKYFDRFKQVRLTISDIVYTSVSKDLSLTRFASLKRLNRNGFEIIGSNEEVDKLMNHIKTLENNNNDAVSSSFFDKF